MKSSVILSSAFLFHFLSFNNVFRPAKDLSVEVKPNLSKQVKTRTSKEDILVGRIKMMAKLWDSEVQSTGSLQIDTKTPLQYYAARGYKFYLVTSKSTYKMYTSNASLFVGFTDGDIKGGKKMKVVNLNPEDRYRAHGTIEGKIIRIRRLEYLGSDTISPLKYGQ